MIETVCKLIGTNKVDTANILQRDYWIDLTESIRSWIVREILVWHTLINLVTVIACIVLAGLFAHWLRPKLLRFIKNRNLEKTAFGRFLDALAKSSPITYPS